VNLVVAEVNKEMQALQASKAGKDAELEAYKARSEALEAQLKVYTTTIANMGNDGYVQASTTSKVNAGRLGVQGKMTILFGDSRPILGQ